MEDKLPDNVIPLIRPSDRKDDRSPNSAAPIFEDIVAANRAKEERLAAERVRRNGQVLKGYRINKGAK